MPEGDTGLGAGESVSVCRVCEGVEMDRYYTASLSLLSSLISQPFLL
jgi:hypothetical protein